MASSGEPWQASGDISTALSGLGIGLTAATVSFVAYLIGSLSENLWNAVPLRMFRNPVVYWDSPAKRLKRREKLTAPRQKGFERHSPT